MERADAPLVCLACAQVFNESGAPTLKWLRQAKVPIVELDSSGTPEDLWSQLLVVGRLMRPAVAPVVGPAQAVDDGRCRL